MCAHLIVLYVYLHGLDVHRHCGFFGEPLFVGTRSNSTHFAIGQPHIVCKNEFYAQCVSRVRGFGQTIITEKLPGDFLHF